MQQKLIILDRDGVINYDSDEYIKSPGEWRPIEGSLEAIARLNRAGYIVTVASNQSGIARGYFDLQTLSAIHTKMDTMLAQEGGRIDAIFFCPHRPEDHCRCRKPKPAMLLDIGQRFNVSLEEVYFIGDTVGDMKTAYAANARPLLVRTGKGSKAELILNAECKQKIPIYDDLSSAADAILDESVQS